MENDSLHKAVILARGLGTRMRRSEGPSALTPEQASVAGTGFKAMIPVGRPFLDYVLSGFADAGYTDVCLVIGPEHGFVRTSYETQVKRLRLRFAIQQEPRGTADALLAAQPFAAADEFVVVNSDNYYPREVLAGLRQLGEPGAVMFDEASLIRNSNIPQERIRAYAYARTSQNGYLLDLIEKPDDATADSLRGSLVSMNCWRFDSGIFEECRAVPLSARGEYELPVAVKQAVHHGMRLKIAPSRSGVLDLSTRADIARVTELLRNVPVSL